jgi:hypothetical protein
VDHRDGPDGATGPVRGAGTGPLAHRLAELDYGRLFLSLDATLADEIWGAPGAAEALRAVVLDREARLPARFLAAELLARHDATFPPPGVAAIVADVLVGALRARLLREANPWYTPPIGPGELGQRLVGFGDAARTALVAALGDDAPLAYGGSREATFARPYGFRVKDVAAALLAAIDGRPAPASPNPRERDAEIKAIGG